MIEVYSWATPNGHKVHIMLEECALPYRVVAVDIGMGDQFKPEFLAISPNNKIPAIVDPDGPDGKRLSLFESGAILLYLAGKTDRFMPADAHGKYEVLQWLMFQMGSVGPMLGQAHHFRVYAPEKLPYAINRYAFEAQRHFGILDARLAKQKYMLGDTYTIVDMNVWGWARLMPNVLGEGAWDKFKNLKRLVDEVSARPAAAKALTLKDRHKFKTDMDQEALHAMFPHLKEKVA
jgi:GST-like protein